MLYSLNYIFRDDQSYLKKDQLTAKELNIIKKFAPGLDTFYLLGYKSVGNLLSSKTYIFTCNAVYIKNTKISFLGLLDVVKKGNSYSFIYIDKTQSYNIDSEVYEYIKKILDLKKSFIQKADDFVYGKKKNIEQALYNYTATFINDDFGPNDRNLLNNIGYYYWEKKNYVHALAYYQAVEKLDDWVACFNMGLIYHYGYDVEKDLSSALHYYKKADKLSPKSPNINLQLGWLYQERKDYTLMLEVFTKYGNNNPDIENQLGLAYWQGLGTRKDLKVAYNHFKKATAKNQQYCYNMAALCREMGKDSEFYQYACKAEKAKHHLSDILMGVAYKDGIGVRLDGKRAESYLQNAVSLNKNNTAALYNLAELYKDHFGYIDKAYEFYKAAADLNHPASCVEIAKMYLSGRYVKMNKDTAAKYVEKAAKAKNVDSRLILAQMYIDGDALPKNSKAAEQHIVKVMNETKSRDVNLFYFEKILKKEIEPRVTTLFDIERIYKEDYRISEEDYQKARDIILKAQTIDFNELNKIFDSMKFN